MQVDIVFFRRCITLGIILFCTTSLSSITMAMEDEGELSPEMAFLEFLGTWEAEDGEWIDPLLFESDQMGNLRIDAEDPSFGILKKDKNNEDREIEENAQAEEHGR